MAINELIKPCYHHYYMFVTKFRHTFQSLSPMCICQSGTENNEYFA